MHAIVLPATSLSATSLYRAREDSSKQPAMGRVIRAQRRGTPGSVFKAHTFHRIGAARLRDLDFAERHGFIRGLIKVFQPSTPPPLPRPFLPLRFNPPCLSFRTISP